METLSALLAICAGNSPVIGEFPAQSQWHRALMFSFICAWINGWVNNREAGDLRRHRAHYDVTVMGNGLISWKQFPSTTIQMLAKLSFDTVPFMDKKIATNLSTCLTVESYTKFCSDKYIKRICRVISKNYCDKYIKVYMRGKRNFHRLWATCHHRGGWLWYIAAEQMGRGCLLLRLNEVFVSYAGNTMTCDL